MPRVYSYYTHTITMTAFYSSYTHVRTTYVQHVCTYSLYVQHVFTTCIYNMYVCATCMYTIDTQAVKKNELPRVGFKPTTLYTLDRALYQLRYQPNLTSHSAPDEQDNYIRIHMRTVFQELKIFPIRSSCK